MDVGNIIAALATLVGSSLSFYGIVQHRKNYNKPYLQRQSIRILFMVPVFSIGALIAVHFPVTGLYSQLSRELYEALVIYSFMRYLLNFLEYDASLNQYVDRKPGPAHIFPLCFLPNLVGGREFVQLFKIGIIQYVIVRPLTAIISFLSQVAEVNTEQHPIVSYVYPSLFAINYISQILAIYSLFIFYTSYREELDPMQPLVKFFSIKLVIVYCTFLAVIIPAAIKMDLFHQLMSWFFTSVAIDDTRALGLKFREMLICSGMLLTSLLHMLAFSYKPFIILSRIPVQGLEISSLG